MKSRPVTNHDRPTGTIRMIKRETKVLKLFQFKFPTAVGVDVEVVLSICYLFLMFLGSLFRACLNVSLGPRHHGGVRYGKMISCLSIVGHCLLYSRLQISSLLYSTACQVTHPTLRLPQKPTYEPQYHTTNLLPLQYVISYSSANERVSGRSVAGRVCGVTNLLYINQIQHCYSGITFFHFYCIVSRTSFSVIQLSVVVGLYL